MADVGPKTHELGIRCDYFLSMAGGKANPERDIYLGISGGKVAEISPWKPEKAKQAKRFIEAKNKVALPGLVNGHAHLAMTLLRGLGDDLPFHDWLFKFVLPTESKFVSADFVRLGTELAVQECIRFGTTTVLDMYFFPEVVGEVIDRAGIRAMIAMPWSSGALPDKDSRHPDRQVAAEQFNDRFKKHERIIPALGPHAPYTCTDELFREVVKASEKFEMPIHTHLCETALEVSDSLKEFKMTPVERLHRLGVLGSRTICAHCVHLTDADIEILSKSKSSMIYNPDSNLKLSSGIAPVTKCMARGVSVGLGTDGSASNNDLSLFGAMDLGTKVQKLAAGSNTAMVAEHALRLATWGGAQALGLLDQLGSLEVGKSADVILVDLNFAHLQPIHDIRSQLVYAVQGLEVDTTICQGRVLMEGKKIPGMDSERAFSEAAKVRDEIQSALRA